MKSAERIERSTRQTDRKAAEKIATQFIRDSVDPSNAAASKATITHAINLLVAGYRQLVAQRKKVIV